MLLSAPESPPSTSSPSESGFLHDSPPMLTNNFELCQLAFHHQIHRSSVDSQVTLTSSPPSQASPAMSALAQLFHSGDASDPTSSSDTSISSQSSTPEKKSSSSTRNSFSLLKARIAAAQLSWPVTALEAKFDEKWPSVGKGATIGRRHKHTGLAKLFAVTEHIENVDSKSTESSDIVV